MVEIPEQVMSICGSILRERGLLLGGSRNPLLLLLPPLFQGPLEKGS